MIVEIVVEVLTILGIATKEAKRGRFSELISCVLCHSLLTGYSEKFFKKLAGEREMEDSLERLDRLTQEEARMASAEQLKMTYGLDVKVMGVDDRVRDVQVEVQDVRGDMQEVGNKVEGRVQDVRGDVQDVRGDVQDVRDDVQVVHGNVQNVRGDVREVGDKIQDVDDKLDQVNRSYLFKPLSFRGLRRLYR